MNKYTKKLFSIAVLVSTFAIIADGNVAPFLNFRSVGRNTARKLVGTTSHHVYLYDMESFYGTFNVTVGYERSFRPKHIAQCLFGTDVDGTTTTTTSSCDTSCDGGRVLTISGLNSENRNNTRDWMAENFYLPRNFKSTIKFTPRVQNIYADFHLYVGLDEWAKGLYFRLYGPVVNARYDLNAEEAIVNPGTNDANGQYAAGFFSGSTTPVPTTSMLTRALDFFDGKTINVDGITAKGLEFAKIKCKKDTNTCFAELRGEFGWNYVQEDYHFGINIQAAAPTGDRPDAEFLFEAQCGNGKHWELGGGIGGHWTLWRSEDDEKHFDFVVEADITHMFKSKQKRTFDLKGKPHSRYMLASKIDANKGNVTTLFGANDTTDAGAGAGGAGTAPNAQFSSEYAPVANFSTRDVKVDVNVQGDVVAMFNYTSRGFSWDIGYNFWGRGCENIELRDKDCVAFPENIWALKGDSFMFGQNQNDNSIVALSATQTGTATTGATIHNGANAPLTGTRPNMADTPGTQSGTNPGIDNRRFAQTTDAGGNRITLIGGDDENRDQTRTSVPMIFIKQDDLDLEGARTRGISHKVFTHFSYTWVDREDWVPYFGVGGEAEFGKRGSDTKSTTTTTTNTDCDSSCLDCAVSKWSIFFKGGVSFD